jgi:DNA-binding IclR family transcriptional regulator
LRDKRGNIVAGLNVVAPSGAFTPDAVTHRILPALLEATSRPIELPAMFSSLAPMRNDHGV